MKTVLVHEWLTNYAGSERVVAALRTCFDDAPVYTSMRWGEPFDTWDVHPSFLQRAAKGPNSHIKVLPLMPVAFRSLRLPETEMVITSFHSFSLYARVPEGTPHLVYCYTPPRFLWRVEHFGARPSAMRRAVNAAAEPLRRADRRLARRAQGFVADSHAVAGRLHAAYGVDSTVVHPPVEVDRFASHRHAPREDWFLAMSRLVPYKRIDLAVEAFTELGWPLVVAGTGRAAEDLARRAGPNIRFIGRVSDEELPGLMARARGLVFPGEEDFGIVPVEAMAAGTPVVAYRAGGIVDTVTEDRSGIFFETQDAASLIDAVKQAAAREWDADDVSASVAHFGESRFAREMRDVVAALAR